MTVSSNPRRAGPYAVNGVTTVFPFDFKVFEKSDVGVVLTIADGSYSFLTLDSDYSLTLNADQDNNPGGSVTYVGSGVTLTMLGALDYEQDTDITNVGRFLPQVLENALDKQTILLQQLLEVSDRTLQAAPGTSVKLAFPAPSSGKFIRWRPDLTGLENADASDNPGLQGLLAASTGAGMLGWLPLGVGGIARTVLAALRGLPLTPRNYGGVGDNLADDFSALAKLADACRLTGLPADLRGGVWRIKGTGTLDFAGVRTILCDMQSPIIDARAGATINALQGTYAMTIGTPGVDWSVGRAQAPNIIGQLFLVAVGSQAGENGRTRPRNGIFVKCSWPNGGAIHAQDYAGTCIDFDSVHDGIVPRLRAEGGGTAQVPQLRFRSQGDTTNCLNIPSLQSEQAYGRIAEITLIRSVVQNLHMERAYIQNTNDGTTTLPNGRNYVNLSINLGNSEIRQMYVDAVAPGTVPPDGSAATTTSALNITVYADGSEISTVEAANADLLVTGGEGAKLSTLNVSNFYQRAPASNTIVEGIKCNLYSVENSVTTIASRYIGTFDPSFNAVLLKTFGGTIGLHNCSNSIQGDISFHGVKIAEVRDTKAPSAGRAATKILGGETGAHTGGFNAQVVFSIGSIGNATPASATKAVYQWLNFGAFAPQGTANYITQGCMCDPSQVVSWTTPAGVWPAYTYTERMGNYSATGSKYIYRPSDNSWQQVAGSP